MKIDFKKIMQEDEKFKDFAKESWAQVVSEDPGAEEFLKLVYVFYHVGLTSEQAAKFIKFHGKL